jgi:hypothetical protein
MCIFTDIERNDNWLKIVSGETDQFSEQVRTVWLNLEDLSPASTAIVAGDLGCAMHLHYASPEKINIRGGPWLQSTVNLRAMQLTCMRPSM